MKVLMTGAGGLLGVSMCELMLDAGVEFFPLFHNLLQANQRNPKISDYAVQELGDRAQSRTENEGRLAAYAERFEPSWIVHLVAWTDVDGCEGKRDLAYAANVDSAMDAAIVSRRRGIPILFVSTDYVFDGSSRVPYLEEDWPRPLSWYGATKLLGEHYVRIANPEQHIVLRTSWLFGPHGKNFVDTIAKRLMDDKPTRVVGDQRGCPTYTRDLCLAMLALMRSEFRGTVHASGSESCTWYELAKEIGTLLGKGDLVSETTTREFGSVAPRPPYSVLNCERLNAQFGGKQVMPAWRESLRTYLDYRAEHMESAP